MKRARSLALLAAAPLLAACVGPKAYLAPSPNVPAVFAGSQGVGRVTASRAWWTAFQDPILNRLIAAGLSQNLSVLQAVERIEEARAGVAGANAGFMPQISGSYFDGRGDRTGAGTTTIDSRSASAGWLLDLFGKVQSGRAAALAQLDAAYASADSARIAMSGSVAQAYTDLRYYQESMALTRASIASRLKTRDLIRSSLESGAATKLDTLQADQLVAVAEAQLPAFETGYSASLNRLATLTGIPTTTLGPMLAKGAGQPSPRFKASVGVPADVVRNRPDVIAAERALAAASANVGVAWAELFPSLSLTGSITSTSLAGASAGKTWSFGPSIDLPIFSGGARQASYTAAESRARQANLTWQLAVRGAVEEIQSSLAAFQRDAQSMAASQRLLSISQETVELARSSYEIGGGTFLSVLDAERALLDARSGLASATRNRALDYINLSTATAAGIGTP